MTTDSKKIDEQDELIGQFIGNYRVHSLIGSGAFGDVYLGKHPSIEREVAIKVLDPSLSQDEEMVKRFNAEARAVNLINHPNIIQIYDFGELEDGRAYFTMELLKGVELAELIKKRAPMSLRETLKIMKGITNGLQAAHDHSIIHRDLKPDNIFVDEQDGKLDVKILDFGIAKLLGGNVKSKYTTSRGMVMGTPLYMSPEQASGSVEEIGPASDIYALGVMIFKMLSDKFPINAKNPRELLFKQVSEPPLKLEKVTRGLPKKVCEVINRTLEKDPLKRQNSVTDFFEELKEAAALVSPDLIAEIVNIGKEENLDDDLRKIRQGYNVNQDSGIYTKPSDHSSVWLILGLLVILGAGATAGWFIWKKVVSHLNASKSNSQTQEIPQETDVKYEVEKVKKKVDDGKREISIISRSPDVEVDVFFNGKQVETRKKAPFVIRAPKGTAVLIRAYREGYDNQSQNFEVDSNVDIELTFRKKIIEQMTPPMKSTIKPRIMKPAPRK